MDPRELLQLNKPIFKGLQMISELIEGSRLLVQPSEYQCDEYCHWTFADDDQKQGEPSYMMARRLKSKAERTAEHASDSAITRSQPLLVDKRPAVQPAGKRAAFIKAIEDAKEERKRRKQEWADSAWHIVTEDTPFKKEAESLNIDPRTLRDLNAAHLKGLQLSSLLKKDTWLQIKPLDEMEAYAEAEEAKATMLNRVVQIDGEGDDYEFWYVLTYLPDLQWCHVAPLERRGVFTEKPSPGGHVAEGQDRWMLVSEEEGGEIDVGAGRCHVMEAVEMKGTRANADTEEWHIVGRAPPGWLGPASADAMRKWLEPKKKGKAAAADLVGGEVVGVDGKTTKAKRKSDGGKRKSSDGKDAVADASVGLAAVKSIVAQLCRRQDAGAFLDPVDWVELDLPDYPTVVTNPMDLGTVLQQLDTGAYATALEAAADVELVFSNAFAYNPEDTWVHKAATAVKAAADKKLAPVLAAERTRQGGVASLAAELAAGAAGEGGGENGAATSDNSTGGGGGGGGSPGEAGGGGVSDGVSNGASGDATGAPSARSAIGVDA